MGPAGPDHGGGVRGRFPQRCLEARECCGAVDVLVKAVKCFRNSGEVGIIRTGIYAPKKARIFGRWAGRNRRPLMASNAADARILKTIIRCRGICDAPLWVLAGCGDAGNEKRLAAESMKVCFLEPLGG